MSALSATQSITGVMHACSRRSRWRLRRRFVGSHVPGVPAQRLRGAEFCTSDRHALLAVSHALVRTCADGLRPPVQAERLHLWRGARTSYSPGALTGSSHGSPDTRGYILQFECVPLGKLQSWGRPWANARVGLQYTGYVRFNGGTANYDGFGRSAGQNDSLFLFLWMAF